MENENSFRENLRQIQPATRAKPYPIVGAETSWRTTGYCGRQLIGRSALAWRNETSGPLAAAGYPSVDSSSGQKQLNVEHYCECFGEGVSKYVESGSFNEACTF